MFPKLILTVLAFFLGSFLQIPALAQTAENEWIRIQSDNGEFSIEVLANYKHYYNKDGFFVSNNANDYRLQDVRILNSIIDGTLLSVEAYKGNKGAFNALYEKDAYKKGAEASEIKNSGHTVKQVVQKSEHSYSIRRYLRSKTHIYVLTVGSREGETPPMKRFLDSVEFKPDLNNAPRPDSVLFSTLRVTEISVEINPNAKASSKPAPNKSKPEQKDERRKSLVILSKPRPSYIDAARYNNVEGTIVIRATFADDGFMPHITVIKSLPEGLLRQVLFAALRMKFLPVENDGKRESIIRNVEYTFDIR